MIYTQLACKRSFLRQIDPNTPPHTAISPYAGVFNDNACSGGAGKMTRQLRDAMSHFATGVTVVTTHFEGQDYGMTCNSFSTVSLDPALVLWSIRKESHSHIAFTNRTNHGGGYMVSILANQQQTVAMQFTHGTQADRFHSVPLERGLSQHPRISGAVAWFDCQLEQVVTAGDHDILIGRVLDFGSHEGESLIYSQRHFGTFKPF